MGTKVLCLKNGTICRQRRLSARRAAEAQLFRTTSAGGNDHQKTESM